jgi:hypothetical protein
MSHGTLVERKIVYNKGKEITYKQTMKENPSVIEVIHKHTADLKR